MICINHSRLVLETMRRASTAGRSLDAVLLCNPNSPTGVAWEAGTVRRLAREAARLGLWCVVDENVCGPLRIGIDSGKPASQDDRAAEFYKVLRASRASCGVCGATRSDEAAKRPSASVVGEHVGAACCQRHCRTTGHRRRSLQFMDRERIRLQRGLERLSGVQVFPTKANFILMELPVGYKAARVVSALRRQGPATRDCSQVPGLNDRSLRVAVRTRDENDRLLKALASIVRVTR